jgi:hypothetical protein
MSKLMSAVLVALFVTVAHAQPNVMQSMDSSCESRAMDKEGKPLAGAARKAFLKKCGAGEADQPAKKAGKADKEAKVGAGPAGSQSCEDKAVSKKTGKKLHGAAKQKFMEKCMRDGACPFEHPLASMKTPA